VILFTSQDIRRTRTIDKRRAASYASPPRSSNAEDTLPDDAAPTRLLERLGLHRPELRAWALYDWANSAYILAVQTAIFPLFFADFAASELPAATATARYAWTTSGATMVIAIMAPFLGALADYRGMKKRLLGTFLALGVTSTAAMFLIQQGDWLLAAILFALGNVGAQGSFVFYDSLLPHVARNPREMDRVSTAGYALGYLGSALLFVVQIAWILRPSLFGLPSGEDLSPAQASLPARLAFVSVALWWLLFSLPLFMRVREPPRRIETDERPSENPLRVAFVRVGETFRELRRYRQAFLMLVAFLIYNDGIGTIIRMALIFGSEIGIGTDALLAAALVAQIVGIPFAFLFGALAGRIGPKRAILLGLAIYIGISVYGYTLRTGTQFFVLAALVGTVQGGCQALSRSLFASLIPKHKSSEFFGFYAVLEKFAGILGPTLFGLTTMLTGSSRNAILSVIAFFVVGALLLTRVRVEEGRKMARQAENDVLVA
jgi:UMF1 family MFS transporter